MEIQQLCFEGEQSRGHGGGGGGENRLRSDAFRYTLQRARERERPLLVRVWLSTWSSMRVMRAEVLQQPSESELWRRWLEGAVWDGERTLEKKYGRKEGKKLLWYRQPLMDLGYSLQCLVTVCEVLPLRHLS